MSNFSTCIFFMMILGVGSFAHAHELYSHDGGNHPHSHAEDDERLAGPDQPALNEVKSNTAAAIADTMSVVADVSRLNPDNDPDLAKAIAHDAEMNGGNRLIASREIAEKHYLRYLSRNPGVSSAQKARVFTQLGVLYTTNVIKEKGEEKDLGTARRYFDKALEAEPDRISMATIRARLHQVGSDQTPEDRIDRRVENYKWLTGLSEQKFRALWMGGEPRESELRSLMGIVKNLEVSQVGNLLHDAQLSSDPKGQLHRIIADLPGTKAESAARKRLQRIKEAILSPVQKVLDQRIGDNSFPLVEEDEIVKAEPLIPVEVDELHMQNESLVVKRPSNKLVYGLAFVAVMLAFGAVWKVCSSKSRKNI